MKQVLYFSADWCGPCKAMKPIIEKFEEEHSDVEIVKIDADDRSDLCIKHSITSVPTFVLLSDDEEVKRKRGAFNEKAFLEFVYGE